MDHAQVWSHIHAQRRALAEALSQLSEQQWSQETLCGGWSVHDVAAHVISTPQIGGRELARMAGRNLGRGYNTMIFREVRHWSATRTHADVLAEFERFDGSTSHVPVTTSIEPLLDVLVHTQDILRPLGLAHEMPPDAAAVAADRARLHARLMGWRDARRVRLVATDAPWQAGRGPVVEGPMQELLMVVTGRAKAATGLTGDGLPLLS